MERAATCWAREHGGLYGLSAVEAVALEVGQGQPGFAGLGVVTGVQSVGRARVRGTQLAFSLDEGRLVSVVGRLRDVTKSKGCDAVSNGRRVDYDPTTDSCVTTRHNGHDRVDTYDVRSGDVLYSRPVRPNTQHVIGCGFQEYTRQAWVASAPTCSPTFSPMVQDQLPVSLLPSGIAQCAHRLHQTGPGPKSIHVAPNGPPMEVVADCSDEPYANLNLDVANDPVSWAAATYHMYSRLESFRDAYLWGLYHYPGANAGFPWKLVHDASAAHPGVVYDYATGEGTMTLNTFAVDDFGTPVHEWGHVISDSYRVASHAQWCAVFDESLAEEMDHRWRAYQARLGNVPPEAPHTPVTLVNGEYRYSNETHFWYPVQSCGIDNCLSVQQICFGSLWSIMKSLRLNVCGAPYGSCASSTAAIIANPSAPEAVYSAEWADTALAYALSTVDQTFMEESQPIPMGFASKQNATYAMVLEQMLEFYALTAQITTDDMNRLHAVFDRIGYIDTGTHCDLANGFRLPGSPLPAACTYKSDLFIEAETGNLVGTLLRDENAPNTASSDAYVNLWNVSTTADRIVIDIANIPPGSYLVRVLARANSPATLEAEVNGTTTSLPITPNVPQNKWAWSDLTPELYFGGEGTLEIYRIGGGETHVDVVLLEPAG